MIVDVEIDDISVNMSSVITLVVVELDKRVDESTEIVVAFGVVIRIVT